MLVREWEKVEKMPLSGGFVALEQSKLPLSARGT